MDFYMKSVRNRIGAGLLAIVVTSLSAITPVTADIIYRNISLKQSVRDGHILDITRGTGVQMNNSSDGPVFNVHVIRRSSGKILFTVADILPGQSMSLEFTTEGSYAVCYATKQSDINNDQCFQIKVINRNPV